MSGAAHTSGIESNSFRLIGVAWNQINSDSDKLGYQWLSQTEMIILPINPCTDGAHINSWKVGEGAHLHKSIYTIRY